MVVMLITPPAVGHTTHPGAPTGPLRCGPTGSWVAWTSDGELWIADPGLGVTHELTGDLDAPVTPARRPQWHPDGGSLLVALGDGSSVDGLAMVGLDGSVTELEGTQNATYDEGFGISPSGDVVGFGARGDVHLVPIDGSEPAGPIDDDGLVVRDGQWSPSGDRIAVGEIFGWASLGEKIDTDIWVLDLDGGAPLLISDAADFQSQEPRWSPDGNRLAYRAGFPMDDSSEAVNAIVVASADGTDDHRSVSPKHVSILNKNPRWSPDGHWIAFTGQPMEQRADLDDFIVPADGSSPPTNLHPGGVGSPAVERFGHGTNVLVLRERADKATGSHRILIADADDLSVREVPQPGMLTEVEDITFAPDDAALAATLGTEAEPFALWTIDLRTDPPTWTQLGASDRWAVWSPPREVQPTFTDVPLDHPFAGPIEWAAGNDIADGYPDGTFRPTLPVSRQAMTAFLHRDAGRPPVPTTDAPTFTDVPLDHPFAGPIEWAAANDIADGYPDGTFRPTLPVSRQAMTAFLCGAAAAPELGVPTTRVPGTV